MYQTIKSVLLTILIFSVYLPAIGQTDIAKEEFSFSFLKTKDGGRLLYSGKAHSFSINIVSDSIKMSESSNLINIDGHTLQTATIPLPESNLDLSNLTTDQQQETLNEYVQYEMDYFKNDLKLNCQNLKREWITINSKIWLLWSFDFPNQKLSENLSEQTKGQIYASTICFNQVLDLNIPLFQKDNFPTGKALINKFMGTLQLYNKHL